MNIQIFNNCIKHKKCLCESLRISTSSNLMFNKKWIVIINRKKRVDNLVKIHICGDPRIIPMLKKNHMWLMRNPAMKCALIRLKLVNLWVQKWFKNSSEKRIRLTNTMVLIKLGNMPTLEAIPMNNLMFQISDTVKITHHRAQKRVAFKSTSRCC